MNRLSYVCVIAALLAGVGCSSQSAEQGGEPSGEKASAAKGMKAPSNFESIEGEEARSRAIFEEMGRALKHPRCVNCHPAGDRPLMGEESEPHQPLVERGKGGFGPPGMRCTTCHNNENYKNVPGRPGWHMAPREMAWEGKSLAEICEQIKDPERNGGKSIDGIVEHIATDNLVAYGWEPPDQYEAVPGSQDLLGKLARAWADSGAHCPEVSATP